MASGSGIAGRIVIACIVATVAFWAYTRTLLPGVDAGDTGGFQAAVLWPQVSARQAYPLYYNLARPFVSAAAPVDPARALNLFSAMWGAVAVGLAVYVSAAITGSLTVQLLNLSNNLCLTSDYLPEEVIQDPSKGKLRAKY